MKLTSWALVGAHLFWCFAAYGATPTVESSANDDGNGNQSSHNFTLPATISADAVILVILGTDDDDGWSMTAGGFAEIAEETGGFSNSLVVYCLAATGTEDGGTITVAPDVPNEDTTYTAYSIIGTANGTCSDVEITTAGQSGTGDATPNPPSETASWGAADNLWLLAASTNNPAGTLVSYPTGCTDNQILVSGGSGATDTATCTYGNGSATQDPDVFTFDTNTAWNAATIVIRGAEDETVVVNPVTGKGGAAAQPIGH